MKKENKFKQRPYCELEELINYTFNDPSLLETALTHSSYSNESRGKGFAAEDNERLEFLGDSVLSVVTTDYLFKNYKDLREGDLTKIRAAVVCEASLARFASEISIGDFMFFGHGETTTRGQYRKSTISDAFEALIAAIYLDGGLEAARSFLMPRVVQGVKISVKKGNEDYKSRLQQIAQQTPEEHLFYDLVQELGPPHDRVFKVRVYLNSNFLGEGSGKSKREAEQAAAKEALETFGEFNE